MPDIHAEAPPGRAPPPGRAFVGRVLVVLGLVALVLLLWSIRGALLLVFAGVVVAVLLLAASRPLERLGLPRGWALLVVALGLAALLGLAGTLVGGQLLAQLAELRAQLPRALDTLDQRFGVQLPGLEETDAGAGSASAGGAGRGGGSDGAGTVLDPSMLGSLAGRLVSLGATLADALLALVVAVVGGFFLAADPGLYRRGVTRLLPEGARAEAESALLACGQALQGWLGAQLVSMLLVGLGAGLGTWALGLPAPLALALFAGLAGFVPLIGAFAGAAPAVLLALGQGAGTALWTVALFLAIQQVESNLVLPLVQRRILNLPPAVLVFAVVAVGTLFGLPGVILAAPISVVVYVLVARVYVRDTLGHPAEVPGER